MLPCTDVKKYNFESKRFFSQINFETWDKIHKTIFLCNTVHVHDNNSKDFLETVLLSKQDNDDEDPTLLTLIILIFMPIMMLVV
jgi:hypothetical protein